MNRLAWLARRLVFSVVALWIVFTLTFAFVTLSGDPGDSAVAYAVAAELAGTGADGEEIEAQAEAAVQQYRDARNLDEPVTSRYVSWSWNLLTLDWGYSYERPVPVTELLAERLQITALYAIPAMGISLGGGVWLGTYAAAGRHRRFARFLTGSSYAVWGIPNFLIASILLLTLPLSIRPGLTGWEFEQSMVAYDNLRRVVLPAIILGTGLMAVQARYVRTQFLETTSEHFVRTHEAMGSDRVMRTRHVLRVAAVPLTTLFVSTLLGVLVLNVIVIEYVFDIPGFGLLTYDAIVNRDLPVIVGTTLVVAVVGIVGNFLQDLSYAILDPRIRLED